MVSIKFIRSEINFALANPTTNYYIRSKTFFIIKCIEEMHGFSEETYIEIKKLKERLEITPDPFDFYKNIKEYYLLNEITEILIDIDRLIENS